MNGGRERAGALGKCRCGHVCVHTTAEKSHKCGRNELSCYAVAVLKFVRGLYLYIKYVFIHQIRIYTSKVHIYIPSHGIFCLKHIWITQFSSFRQKVKLFFVTYAYFTAFCSFVPHSLRFFFYDFPPHCLLTRMCRIKCEINKCLGKKKTSKKNKINKN